MRPVRDFLKENSRTKKGQVAPSLGVAPSSGQGKCAEAYEGKGGSVSTEREQREKMCSQSDGGELTLWQALPQAVVMEDFRACAEGSRGKQAKLRPVCAEDFTEAKAEVTTSVNSDGHAMTELKQWNAKYGEGDRSGYQDKTLSYFM
jgi:hypothetical protein